jgi:hypothetical protein
MKVRKHCGLAAASLCAFQDELTSFKSLAGLLTPIYQLPPKSQ